MVEAVDQSFAELLKHYRAGVRLTQEQLAERAGLSVRGISDLERGVKLHPYPHTVEQLVQALELAEGDAGRLRRAARNVKGRDESTEACRPGRLSVSLPSQLTSFVGRQQEVEDVSTLLAQEKVRLLSLTGPGGVGKTRLALQAAEAVGDRFPDGAVFVSLAPVSDPALVASTIATCLKLSGGDQPILDTITDHLREKRLLVILDNFEHLLEAGGIVSQLLVACPTLKVLVTSRAVLHLAAEQEYPVSPLPVPVAGHLPDWEALARYDAVQLFLQRARAVKPGFALTEENALAIAEICQRVDGLPLAIELAASRVRLFSAPELARRLVHRLKLLTGGPHDQPPRHQTLRNTIDWSYRLLMVDEQRLLARLSVFAGGCSLEAAEQVCSPGDGGLLEGIACLIDQSLLQVTDEDQPRFQMLETIREYANEQLEASGDSELVRHRHAQYFLRWAQEAQTRTTGWEQMSWLDRMEREHDNLRAALRWFHERADVEHASLLACALDDLWLNRGHAEEAARWVTTLLSTRDVVSRRTRARLLIRARWFTESMLHLKEALQLYRELGDVTGCALALCAMAGLALKRGDNIRAARLASQGLVLARREGDTWLTAETLQVLGAAVGCNGDLERAQELLQESLGMFRVVGNPGIVAWTARWLAYVAFLQGDYPLALAMGNEALRIERDLGNSDGATAVTWIVGLARLELGMTQQAETVLISGLRLERVGTPGVGIHLEAMATVAARSAQLERAACLWGAADAAREHQRRRWSASNLHWEAYFARHRDSVRSQLGESAWMAAWQIGHAMTAEHGIAYALD